MASVVKYTSPKGDEWEFRNPTISVAEVPVLSADNYNVIAVRIVVTIRSFIFATSASGEDLSSKRWKARKALEQAGGTFIWTDDAVGQSVPVLKLSPDTDTQWGPYPSEIMFGRFFGSNCIEIIWSISSVRSQNWHNDDKGEPYDLVYTIQSTLDQNYYTTRTINGVLTLRGHEHLQERNADPSAFEGADAYRETIEEGICSCPAGWQQVGSNYVQSADGLSLSFSVIHQQRYVVLPYQVTSGDVTLSCGAALSDVKDAGYGVTFTLSGYYESPSMYPDAPMNAFMDLVAALFGKDLYDSDNQTILQSVSFVKPLYRCYLGFQMSWIVPTSQIGLFGNSNTSGGSQAQIATAYSLLSIQRANEWLLKYKDAFADAGVSPSYGTTDVSGYCGSYYPVDPLPMDQNASATLRTGTPGDNKTIISDQQPPTGPTATKADNTSAYLMWRQRFTYHFDFGRVLLPVMASDAQDILLRKNRPQVFCLISGVATRAGWPVEIPEPPFSENLSNADAFAGVDVLVARQSHDAPQPGPVYSASWNYVVRLQTNTEDLAKGFDANKFIPIPSSPFVIHAPEEGIDWDVAKINSSLNEQTGS